MMQIILQEEDACQELLKQDDKITKEGKGEFRHKFGWAEQNIRGKFWVEGD